MISEQAEELIKQLGNDLLDLVSARFESGWVTAFLDARYDGRGGFICKIRVAADNASESIESNSNIDLALITLDGCRNHAEPEWHGLLITISPKTNCNVQFNYDAACEDDPTFFDD